MQRGIIIIIISKGSVISIKQYAGQAWYNYIIISRAIIIRAGRAVF